MFPTYQVIFFIFAIVLIAAAVMVIVSRNPVHSILFLVLAFFASAILWMMLQAEFLALILIFVYVGVITESTFTFRDLIHYQVRCDSSICCYVVTRHTERL